MTDTTERHHRPFVAQFIVSPDTELDDHDGSPDEFGLTNPMHRRLDGESSGRSPDLDRSCRTLIFLGMD